MSFDWLAVLVGRSCDGKRRRDGNTECGAQDEGPSSSPRNPAKWPPLRRIWPQRDLSAVTSGATREWGHTEDFSGGEDESCIRDNSLADRQR